MARRSYLGFHVIKGWRADDREADQENVGLWVGEWSEAVVIFLSGGIPQSQADRSAVDHHAGRVVVEAVRSRESATRLLFKSPRCVETRRETNTVGMYSPGKAFVVYEIRRHV